MWRLAFYSRVENTCMISLKRMRFVYMRIVWRYQRANQNPYIEEGQTIQWPNEKVQKDKQRATKHTYKTKDRVTGTPLKTCGELWCSGRLTTPPFIEVPVPNQESDLLCIWVLVVSILSLSTTFRLVFEDVPCDIFCFSYFHSLRNGNNICSCR